MPAFVDLSKGHVEFIVDSYICKPLKGFLGFGPGGVGSNADMIFSGHPWLCTVAGQVGNAAGAIAAFTVFPGSWSLPLAAGRTEDGAVWKICTAFYTGSHFRPCLSRANLVS